MVIVYLHNGSGPNPWMTNIMQWVWMRAAAEGCGIYNMQWIHGSTDNKEANFSGGLVCMGCELEVW